MKKHLTFLFLFFATFSISFSQTATEPTFSPQLHLSVFTGPSVNNVSPGGSPIVPQNAYRGSISPRSSMGTWNTGISLEYRFSHCFSLSTSPSYGIEGYDFDFTFERLPSNVNSTPAYYEGNLLYEVQTLRIPVNFHVNFGEKIQWSAFAGTYFNARGKYTARGIIDQQGTADQTTVATSNFREENADFNSFKPASTIGISAGVQARIPLGRGNVLLRARAGRDLTTFIYPSAKLQWIGAEIGYGIRLF